MDHLLPAPIILSNSYCRRELKQHKTFPGQLKCPGLQQPTQPSENQRNQNFPFLNDNGNLITNKSLHNPISMLLQLVYQTYIQRHKLRCSGLHRKSSLAFVYGMPHIKLRRHRSNYTHTVARYTQTRSVRKTEETNILVGIKLIQMATYLHSATQRESLRSSVARSSRSGGI